MSRKCGYWERRSGTGDWQGWLDRDTSTHGQHFWVCVPFTLYNLWKLFWGISGISSNRSPLQCHVEGLVDVYLFVSPTIVRLILFAYSEALDGQPSWTFIRPCSCFVKADPSIIGFHDYVRGWKWSWHKHLGTSIERPLVNSCLNHSMDQVREACEFRSNMQCWISVGHVQKQTGDTNCKTCCNLEV